MQHSYPNSKHVTHHASVPNGETQGLGAWLSILGLLAWLLAMVLAVAGPLLNIDIPASLVVGMVVFSGIFSLLSLPRLLGTNAKDEND